MGQQGQKLGQAFCVTEGWLCPQPGDAVQTPERPPHLLITPSSAPRLGPASSTLCRGLWGVSSPLSTCSRKSMRLRDKATHLPCSMASKGTPLGEKFQGMVPDSLFKQPLRCIRTSLP